MKTFKHYLCFAKKRLIYLSVNQPVRFLSWEKLLAIVFKLHSFQPNVSGGGGGGGTGGSGLPAGGSMKIVTDEVLPSSHH